MSTQQQQQQHLAFEPITVRGVVLSNRIVMAPMTRRSAPGGIVGEPNATYYAKRAAGGVGLIITEGVQVNNTDAVDQPNTPQCFTDEQIAGWKSVVDACKAATNGSSKLCMQIWHTGLYSLDPIGPTGGIDVSNEQRKVPLGKEATPADIERIMDEMALCASNAVHRCGFDAVQIHGAHGYFIDSFSSPVLNQRDDAFGGDAHRRAMLAAAVTRKVRAAIGDKALLLFRFSQWIVTDYQHQKFPSSTELRVFLETIVQAGVDVVDMSTRRMLDVAYPSEHSTRTFAGWVKHIISEMGSSVKVIAVGSATVGRMFGEGAMTDAFELRDPTPVLSLIDEGEADLLGVGRALISDADWVNKVRTGQWESLVPYSADALKVLQ